MGFLLLGLAGGSRRTATAAAMYYAMCYALMATAAFGVILAAGARGFRVRG